MIDLRITIFDLRSKSKVFQEEWYPDFEGVKSSCFQKSLILAGK